MLYGKISSILFFILRSSGYLVALVVFILFQRIAYAEIISSGTLTPSVGHRPSKPDTFSGGYTGIGGAYAAPVATPGLWIAGDTSCLRPKDVDNDFGAKETFQNYRTIYRVKGTKKTVIPGEDNIPVSICGSSPVYNLTNDDVGYRLRFETKRVSSATSHTPTPSESEVEVHESVEISPPFVRSSPVLYVNGIERTSNIVSKNDKNVTVRFQLKNINGELVSGLSNHLRVYSTSGDGDSIIRWEFKEVSKGIYEIPLDVHKASKKQYIEISRIHYLIHTMILWNKSIKIEVTL